MKKITAITGGETPGFMFSIQNGFIFALASRLPQSRVITSAARSISVALVMVWIMAQGLNAQAAAPDLVSPMNGAAGQVHSPTLVWSSVIDASSYRVQMSADKNFGTTVIDQSDSGTTLKAANDNAAGMSYFWHVRAVNAAGGLGAWSGTWSFTTTHFNVRFNTGENMTVFILPASPPSITIDDSSLNLGDEIGAE